MPNDLTVTLVQADLHWHDPAANRAQFDELLGALTAPTDLVVLPEMFTTGFSMDAAGQAETMQGPTVAWLRATAARLGAVVTGSVIIRAGDHYHNRLLWVRPDGTLAHYDKRHLFTFAGEHRTYAAGLGAPLVEAWRGWRICPLICYDLRFPVWSRNPAAAPYDLLLYVANWPAVRRGPWQVLLQARALENLAYVAGVNRIGTDGIGHAYAGDSALLNMRGEYVAEAAGAPGCITRTLSWEGLQDFRAEFPALQDGDEFTLAGW
ncbi:amidohydrolase [Hymenobacter coccineus]|uniref:Omega-amidase YafV n=1 Tax=Hymenobacter coccineus TaxID=1908235 RepID=A0A1G1TLR5_9BACT|nr:amidohydrolase [Hymenobacter coccineus]OGX91800.1 amidohydrolase [Hymenobacter coccineus]